MRNERTHASSRVFRVADNERRWLDTPVIGIRLGAFVTSRAIKRSNHPSRGVNGGDRFIEALNFHQTLRIAAYKCLAAFYEWMLPFLSVSPIEYSSSGNGCRQINFLLLIEALMILSILSKPLEFPRLIR